MKKSESIAGILFFIFTLPFSVFAQGNVKIDSSALVSRFPIKGLKSYDKIDMSSMSLKSMRLTLTYLAGIIDFKRAGSINSSNYYIYDQYKNFSRNDSIRKIRMPYQPAISAMFKPDNYYFVKNCKTPQLYNFDYEFMDFPDMYFSNTERNYVNYITGKDLYYSKRGYFMSTKDNTPRYLNTKGIYHDDDDSLILLLLFDIFAEIGRK